MLHFESTQGLCPGESTSGGSKRDSIVGADLVPGSHAFAFLSGLFLPRVADSPLQVSILFPQGPYLFS